MNIRHSPALPAHYTVVDMSKIDSLLYGPFLLYGVCRRHRQAVLDAATSRKALPPQMLKLNDNTGRGRHAGHSPR